MKSPWVLAALSTACLITSAGVRAADSFFAFTPDSALDADIGALSPEGCLAEPGLARGRLTRSSTNTTCHSGQWGADAHNVTQCGGAVCEPQKQAKAHFDTPTLSQPLALGGTATLVAYYFAGNENHSPFPLVPYPENARARLEYTVEDVWPLAISTSTIARGRAFALNPGGTGGIYRGAAAFRFPAYTVPAGHRLRVTVTSTASPDGRILFGGAPLASTPAFGARSSYHDAGITFDGEGAAADSGGEPPVVIPPSDPLPEDPADPQPDSEAEDEPSTQSRSGSGGGSLPFTTLAVLLFAGLRRRKP